MKTLLLDNYDSFTYNLYHLLTELGEEVDVVRNDKVDVDRLGGYARIILSPGPGVPSEAGSLLDVIRRYATEKPILGVCLGHQAIGEAFGGQLTNLTEVFHGVQSEVMNLHNDYIFEGIDTKFKVGRYHSWVVDTQGLPDCLEVTAISGEGQIMAMRHSELEVHGIQFHPESVLTPEGQIMVKNFLKGDKR